MTYKYNKVYVGNYSTVVDPYEKNGPLSSSFDKSYDDLYFGEKNDRKIFRRNVFWNKTR